MSQNAVQKLKLQSYFTENTIQNSFYVFCMDVKDSYFEGRTYKYLKIFELEKHDVFNQDII